MFSFIIDDDMMKLLPSDLDSKIAWDDIQDEFGSTELIYISFGLKDRSIFNPESFAALWDLTKSLETQNDIEKVFSLSNANRIDNIDDFMEVDIFQSERILSQEDINEIQDYLEKNPSFKKRFVSENNEYFAVTAQPYSNETFDNFSKIVVKETDRILQGYEIHYLSLIHI